MPALPLDEAGKYVAAAYIVFMLIVFIYVGIMAARLQRMEDRLRDLEDDQATPAATVDEDGSNNG